jgi:hypothetical protein
VTEFVARMKPTGPARSGRPDDRLREIRERCLKGERRSRISLTLVRPRYGKAQPRSRCENIVIAREAKQSSSATTFAQASGLLRRSRSPQ